MSQEQAMFNSKWSLRQELTFHSTDMDTNSDMDSDISLKLIMLNNDVQK